ncbi:MAG: hypothetical protein CVV37_03935 [Nitrospira bacterium HGW-Nitrospira-1]|nr:MAG: hypothetical protein CVV37_03935 [Nitrospira bacterium HGW-Nitrospira-1]
MTSRSHWRSLQVCCLSCLKSRADKKRIRFLTITNSLAFISGFSLIFIALGASSSVAGKFLFEYQDWIRIIGGILVIFFGLFVSGIIRLDFLSREKKFHLSGKPAGYIGTFFVGMTFAAAWTPCIGPILGTILVYASSKGSAAYGFKLLSVYSLGLALPFFLSSLMFNSFLSYSVKIRKYMRVIMIASGLLLIVFGILLLTNNVRQLTSFFPDMGMFACSGDDTARDDKHKQQKYSPSKYASPPLVLSVLPVESAGAMYERFLPLKYYLENQLKRPVIIKVAKDYESAVRGIGEGVVHLAFLDPAAYCEVMAQYKNRVVPLVRSMGKEGATSRSVLVVKDNSGIEKAADVKGKRLALGNKQSSFSYLIPLAMLNDVGLRVNDFASVDFLEQEDRVALSVLIGDHEVGALSESVARKYTGDGLKIIKTSEAIPSFVLCASNILPQEIKTAVVKVLGSLQGRGTISAIDSDIEGFAAAEDRDFDVIRVMIKNLTGKDYIEYRPKTIKVAVLPLYSAITIYNRYDPLMRYLSQKTGYEFKLVIPKDFEDFMRVVKSGKVDFSYQNPYIFALIDREVDIKPLVTTIGEDSPSEGSKDNGDSYRGVIITRQDSAIRNISGLRNKKILITSPMSAGGYLSQRLFLMKAGIDTEKDMKIIDAKRQENVILGVYRGEADAGFVRGSALVVWKDAVDMKKIRVLARTTPIPNWPFAACGKSNPSLVGEVKRLLIDLKDEAILQAARIKGFKAAGDADFEVFRQY